MGTHAPHYKNTYVIEYKCNNCDETHRTVIASAAVRAHQITVAEVADMMSVGVDVDKVWEQRTIIQNGIESESELEDVTADILIAILACDLL